MSKEGPVSPGEQKVQEYAQRIRSGESKESIYDGLPDSFKEGIERTLNMSADDSQKTLQNESDRKEEVRARLGLGTNEREELSGWSASYELARIAKDAHVDLSTLSREEYAEYAIKNGLAIDDSQLRAAPWQRTATSPEEIVQSNKERRAHINEDVEKDFARFCFQMMEKAGTDNREIEPGIRIRQGTKDSNSWLFFGINEGAKEAGDETHKSYISLKDLNSLSPARFTNFMEDLRDAGYKGDIKIFQDLSEQGLMLSDQIVMHGSTEEDAALGLKVAGEYFGNDLGQQGLGKDETIEGKSYSYSQILAKRIADSIKNT